MGPAQAAGPVHPDTQALLLLCADLSPGAGPKPLTLGEYNALAGWLASRQRRPASLLDGGELPDEDGEPDRLRALLARGMQVATALERWQRMGLWVVGRGEPGYPERLRRVLRQNAPPLLYGVGDAALLTRGGLAVVGSRDTDADGLAFTRRIAERCAAEHVQLVSGGARGVDQEAMATALNAGGTAAVVLSDRLDRAATVRENREAIRSGRLVLVSPYEPEVGFAVGRAMGRNKHIYALSDHALVVHFTPEEGGTWAGAAERLRANRAGGAFVPVFVRDEGNDPAGLTALLGRGALRFPDVSDGGLLAALDVTVTSVARPPVQPGLFDVPPASHSPPEAVAPPALAPAPPAEPVRSVLVPGGTSFYELCLPLLLRCLSEGTVGARDLPALARRLDVQPAQLKAWLERAVKDGAVEVATVKRKKAYRPAAGRAA